VDGETVVWYATWYVKWVTITSVPNDAGTGDIGTGGYPASGVATCEAMGSMSDADTCFLGLIEDASTSSRSVDSVIRSGKAFTAFGTEYDYYPIEKYYGPSRHMTLVFNIFVFMQIFNFINSRKIEDEWNVFEAITNSSWFIGINILIVFLQVLIVQFGDRAMACSWGGLNMSQWIWCVMIGSTGLIISLLTKVFASEPTEAEKAALERQKTHSGAAQM